jgi:hypothetical protein
MRLLVEKSGNCVECLLESDRMQAREAKGGKHNITVSYTQIKMGARSRKMIYLESRARPMRKAENLAAIYEPF